MRKPMVCGVVTALVAVAVILFMAARTETVGKTVVSQVFMDTFGNYSVLIDGGNEWILERFPSDGERSVAVFTDVPQGQPMWFDGERSGFRRHWRAVRIHVRSKDDIRKGI